MDRGDNCVDSCPLIVEVLREMEEIKRRVPMIERPSMYTARAPKDPRVVERPDSENDTPALSDRREP